MVHPEAVDLEVAGPEGVVQEEMILTEATQALRKVALEGMAIMAGQMGDSKETHQAFLMETAPKATNSCTNLRYIA